MSENFTNGAPVGRPTRHGCLTAWLVFMIIANAACVLIYAVAPLILPPRPNWVLYPLLAAGVVNLICAIALWRFAKWGFWGSLISSLVVFALNIYLKVNFGLALLGLGGVLVLLLLLQLGKPKSAWAQLR